MSMWFSGMSDSRVRCNLEAMSIFLSLFLFSLQVFYHFFLFRLLIELLAIQKERAIDNQSASFIFRRVSAPHLANPTIKPRCYSGRGGGFYP